MTPTSFIIDSNSGISGSLQRLATGETYLVAGDGVTITSQSNGQVVISAQNQNTSSINFGLFGVGTDGNAVLDGTNTVTWASKSGTEYTMTRDAYLTSLTVDSLVTLKVSSYRIFVDGNTVVSGTIENSGQNRFGAPNGTLKGGAQGNLTSDGDIGDLGGNGGNGDSYNGGVSTGDGPKFVPDILSMIKINASVGTVEPVIPGSGGGGGTGGHYGGGGGGFVVIVSRTLELTSGSQINAIGGAGFVGSSGGGGGGVIVTVTQEQLVNSGTIAVTGGSGYNSGSDGLIMNFQVG